MTERNSTQSMPDVMHAGNPAPAMEGCTVYIFGHSYNNNPPTPWANRFITRCGCLLATNQAINGTSVTDAAKTLLKLGYNQVNQFGSTGTVLTLDSLINDVAGYTLRPSQGVVPYQNGLRAFLRAAQAGVQVDDGSGTYTGTWTTVTGQTGTYGGTYRSTVTQNDSVAFTVVVPPSGVVTIMLMSNDPTGPTAAASYSITRTSGGSPVVASGSAAGAYYQTPATSTPAAYGPFPVVLTGQPSGSQTFTITKTDASGTILLVDCVIPESPRGAPGIILMKDPHCPAYPDAAVDLFRAAMDSVVAEFTTDFDGLGGNNITIVDPQATGAWDKSTMVKSDGIHPNQQGNAVMAGSAVSAMANKPHVFGQNFYWRNGVYIPVAPGGKHLFTNLKTFTSDPTYVYSMDGTDLMYLANGDGKLLITGGTGWKPGIYTITGTQQNYSTPDGTKNMWSLSSAPAAANLTTGVGYPIRP